jgi:Flp pilus assembly protein TadD
MPALAQSTALPLALPLSQALGDITLAEQHFQQGVVHQSAGEAEQAQACFRQAIARWPACAAAWANLGMLQEDEGATAEAERSYRQALAIEPGLFEAHMNLASLLASLHRFDEAEAAYGRAIAVRPDAPAAWSNLGAMLACVHRDVDALACCQHALALDPSYDKARFNLAYPLLRQGRLAEGWLCNEARESQRVLQDQLQGPRWMGEPLQGSTLLIVTDAGHGDLIQMARYAPQLRALGAGRLVIVCQPALKALMQRPSSPEAGFDEVLSFDDALLRQHWDCWVALMSLPFLCGTQLGSIPAPLPYLQPDPVRVAQRAAHLPTPSLRVGLVWRGNPLHENDADRSLPSLSLLAPLGRVPGVHFVSLQCGAAQAEALTPPAGLPLQALAEPLSDFADTAAVVANLDLVIGVDTSVIHLAGALGKPVWVMLPRHKADWRWLQDRADSPWYPGVMRLFRQAEMGEWAPVVEQVAHALTSWQEAARSGPRR